MPRLPAEIERAVVNQLRNDMPSLRLCSLVSRDWAYASYRHLYRTTTTLLVDDNDVLSYGLYRGQRALKRLLDLLTSPISSLAHHIQHLRIVNDAARKPFEMPHYTCKFPVSIETLADVIPALANLRTLELDAELDGPGFVFMPSTRHALDALYISTSNEWPSKDTLVHTFALVSLFSSIDTLHFCSMGYGGYYPYASRFPGWHDFPHQMAIRSVVLHSISHVWVSAMHSFLCRSRDPDVPFCSVALLPHPTEPRCRDMCSFLWYASKEIRCVQLHAGRFAQYQIDLQPEPQVQGDPRSIEEVLSAALTQCTLLDTLMFTLETEETTPADESSQSLALSLGLSVDVLNTATMPALGKVVFRVSLRSADDPVLALPSKWAAVDSALVKIDSLRSVVLDLAFGSVNVSSGIVERFTKLLPQTSQKEGMLTFRNNAAL
ncbi:hypothetical protein C8Q77DRAFT_569675 [Trametes polyzona]|nr:hypothetical protein C8Q77DRAFT_569675 [Trametes polyzona]